MKVHKLSTRPGLNERFAKEKCGEAMDFAFGYVDKAFEDMVTHGSEERIFNEVLKRLEIKFERKSHELIEGAVDCWRISKMTDIGSNYTTAFNKAFREICRSDKFQQAIKDTEDGALDELFFKDLDTNDDFSNDEIRFESQLSERFKFIWKNEIVKICKENGIQKNLKDLLDKIFQRSFDDLSLSYK